jgi:hypothetical protein
MPSLNPYPVKEFRGSKVQGSQIRFKVNHFCLIGLIGLIRSIGSVSANQFNQ